MSDVSALGTYLLDAVGLLGGERLAVVADGDRVAAAAAVMRLATDRGARAELVVTVRDYRREADMPAEALEAIQRADAILLLVSTDRAQFGGHAAFRKAASVRGARLGFVVDDVLPGDPRRIRECIARTRALAELLDQAQRAEVRTPAGTQLEMDLSARAGIAITPDLVAPAAWGALPDYMEAAVAPREGTAHGVIVVDGTCTHSGLQTEPMRIDVAGGLATDLRGGTAQLLRAYLDESGDPAARNVAELGIGTNDLVDTAGLVGTFVDKRMAGTAHIGIGDNISLGGRTVAPLHTDVQMLDVTIELDGRRVVHAGKVLL